MCRELSILLSTVFFLPPERLHAAQWQTALDYVSARPSVNEVIFSGGDPLMAAGNQRQGQQNPAGFVFGVKLPISINDIDVFLHFL